MLKNNKNKKTILTFFNDEVAHDQGHGVSGVDVVAAVDVLAVDRQAHARQKLEDALRDLSGRRYVQFRRAHVFLQSSL